METIRFELDDGCGHAVIRVDKIKNIRDEGGYFTVTTDGAGSFYTAPSAAGFDIMATLYANKAREAQEREQSTPEDSIK